MKGDSVLLYLLLVFAGTLLFWGFLYLSTPTVTGTLTLSPAEDATRELQLTSGQQFSIWLSTLPPGMSGRHAMDWVINFYVLDMNGSKVLDETGIAATGWSNPLSFVAQETGAYTMHFDNSIGGAFDKAVNFSYRITQSVFGVSVELMAMFVSILFGFLSLVAVIALVFRRRLSRYS